MVNSITRGSIWWVNLTGYSDSSVQSGFRPVVVISSTAGCKSSDIVSVCPLTTQIKPIAVNITLKSSITGKPQQVLTNQIVTVPKSALTNYVGRVDPGDMSKIELGVAISLGLHLKDGPILNQSNSGATYHELENLISQAKEIRDKLTLLIGEKTESVKTDDNVKVYLKRTSEEIRSFVIDWEDPGSNRNDVAKAYGFNSYKAAYNFWVNHRDKIKR
jgi:mRNA-degrading endonuclease toxin of MazEF toxin-antitoxin module